MEQSEHEEAVLAAVLPDEQDRLAHLLMATTAEHFEDPSLRDFYGLLRKWAERFGGAVLKKSRLEALAENDGQSGQRAMLHLELFEKLEETSVAEDEFRFSIEQLERALQERRLDAAITGARERLRAGVEVDGETIRGPEATRRFLAEQLASIEQSAQAAVTTSVVMRGDPSSVLAEYQQRREDTAAGIAPGVRFGIPPLDEPIKGLRPGSLTFAGAAPGGGKTALMIQLAWSAAVEQGKNVIFYTTETLWWEVRERLLARHSRQPQFEPIAGMTGINSSDIRNDNPAIAPALDAVISDFYTAPGYGSVNIVQVPPGATVETLGQSAEHIHRTEFDVDLVILDYLTQIQTDRRFQGHREEYVHSIKALKRLAVGFADGTGVAAVTPWQFTRQALEEARKVGHFKLTDFAETAEVERQADVAIGHFAMEDSADRFQSVTMGVMKQRSGPPAEDIIVQFDRATNRFSTEATMSARGSTLSFGRSTQDVQSALFG